jgi:hypothetical protein
MASERKSTRTGTELSYKKNRPLFQKVNDGDHWDTSLPSPSASNKYSLSISPDKKVTPPRHRKQVGNAAFISSLERILDSSESTPERPKEPLKKYEGPEVPVTMDQLYNLEDSVHAAKKETFKLGLERD